MKSICVVLLCSVLLAFVRPDTMPMNLYPNQNVQHQNVQYQNAQHHNNMQANELFHLFDMELMKKLDKRNYGNFLVSPLSLKLVLAMVLEGAGKGSDTERELTDAINSASGKEQIKRIFKDILQKLNNTQRGVQFKNANRIFVSNQVTPKENFAKILRNYYSSDIESVDFGDPIRAANNINDWVKDVTRGLIPNLVNANSITQATSIILANALYFKGLWQKSFNRDTTARSCFYNKDPKSENGCFRTYLMDATDTYNYAEWKVNDLEVKALEIPYKGDEFSMLILLPRKDLLSRIIPNLSIIYPKILQNLKPTEVTAFIPRFSIDFHEDLAIVLGEMDIRSIFQSNLANLSEMLHGNTNHYVSNVFHKARIEVNEEGTEAAASTGFVVIPLMGTSKPIFRADHPFIFFVRHNPTGAILFAGKVTEPEAAEEKSEEYPDHTAPLEVEDTPVLVPTSVHGNQRPVGTNYQRGQNNRNEENVNNISIKERVNSEESIAFEHETRRYNQYNDDRSRTSTQQQGTYQSQPDPYNEQVQRQAVQQNYRRPNQPSTVITLPQNTQLKFTIEQHRILNPPYQNYNQQFQHQPNYQ